MKPLAMFMLMCGVLAMVTVPGARGASRSADGARVSVLSEQDPAEPVAMGACRGSAPCCEFNEDGTCRLKMICFGTLWVCP